MKRDLLFISELVDLWPEKSYDGIRMMIKRRKIKAVHRLTKHEALKEEPTWGLGGGGAARRIFIDIDDPTIPDTVRARYYEKIGQHTAEVDGKKAPGLSPLELSTVTPASCQQGPVAERASGALSVPAGFVPPVPEVIKKIAMAKVDLIVMWRDYRVRARCGRNLSVVDAEFEMAYNSRLVSPEIYDALGNVGIKSLYRWAKDLNETLDYMRLVPSRIFGRTEPGLTSQEKSLFLDCLLNPARMNVGEGTRVTKAVLHKRGALSPSSPMTFRRWADFFKSKNSHLWTLMREGQRALLDKEVPHIKRDASKLNVGAVLVADGHRLNFQVINPFTGKPCRATILGYVDWKSWDLVGLEIMVEENTQCIASALRQGIIRLGKIPQIAYQDNGKAFRARFFTSTDDFREAGFCGLFGRLGITPVFAAPRNARAKVIERFWKEFTGKFERLLPSFTGSSVEDKPAWMRAGEKFHRIVHNGYVPTIGETAEMVHLWIRDYWEQQPCPHVRGRTIGQVFEEGRGSGVDIEQLDDLMLATAVKTIHANGIRFLGSDYYDETLFGLRDQTIIRYSLADLSYVQVYDLSGGFLCTAKRAMPAHPMAKHLGNAKDMAELKHLQNEHKKQKDSVVKLAKSFIQSKGDAAPWNDIINAVPEVVEQLERANIELPGHSEEVRIPDFMLKRNQAKDPLPAVIASEEPHEAARAEQQIDPVREAAETLARPDFGMDSIPRYEWHLKHGCVTEDDEKWVAWFKTTPAYKDAYLFFERQAEECRKRKDTREVGHAYR